MYKESILSHIKDLSDEDYKEVLYAAMDHSRHAEINRAIIKHCQKLGKMKHNGIKSKESPRREHPRNATQRKIPEIRSQFVKGRSQ